MSGLSWPRTELLHLAFLLASTSTIALLSHSLYYELVAASAPGIWFLTDTHSMKFFAHPDLDAFRRQELVPRFAKVAVEKPKESRAGTLRVS